MNLKETPSRAQLLNCYSLSKCAAGLAIETPCVAGLSYDPESHVCNYPDSVPECAGQSEAVVGFKCPHPAELPPDARR